MAKIKLVETGWSMIPEDDYVFKVESVDYKEDFGKLEINLITASGRTHQERYSLLTAKGTLNEGAQRAFSFFAKTALNNFDLEEIDHDDLVGCYVSATVEHVESETISEKTGEPFINVRLQKLAPAVSFKDNVRNEASDDENEDEVDLDDFLD